MSDYIEKRKFARAKSDFDVLCYIGSVMEIPFKCQTMDIGQGGLKILSPRDFVAGHEFVVKIYMPFSNIPVEVVSEVRWCKKSTRQPGYYDAGVQFIFLSPEQQQLVNDYVARVIAIESEE
ncbi:MAG: PilZ domain-containing protein [Candidatus Omnitrophica bacterium]|nr:PilZ domain-containing protein [Candidatus Omnitrophota bacterium]